jgi:site-specific DNA recombinase
VVIYIRVSTTEQAEEGYSLREQERECRLFAERHGWQVYQVCEDDGYSGTRDDRPAFQRLLRDGEDGKFQGVVIHKLDRAYRSAQGMLATFSDWQSQCIFLASVSENLDFTTVWGKLILVVLSMLAEIFVTNLREETKKGLRGKFAEGIHNGWLPWGYCRGRCANCIDANGLGYCWRVGLPDLTTGRELAAHPLDSQAYRHAHQMYCTGRYSDRDIATPSTAIRWKPLTGNACRCARGASRANSRGPSRRNSAATR